MPGHATKIGSVAKADVRRLLIECRLAIDSLRSRSEEAVGRPARLANDSYLVSPPPHSPGQMQTFQTGLRGLPTSRPPRPLGDMRGAGAAQMLARWGAVLDP